MIGECLVILLPRAAGLRRLGEVLQRRAEYAGFLGEDAVSDTHQFGQGNPGRRPYGHSSMIGDT
jgi:hypothetical protein